MSNTLRGMAALLVIPLATRAQTVKSPSSDSALAHAVTHLADITWSGSPAGLSSAELEGDPRVADKPYSLLLKLHDGFWIRPHWHPRDKRVVVLSGTLLMGMGDRIDSASAQRLTAGEIALMPANAHHFEGARGETILLLYGIGPLTTTYVSPQQNERQSSERQCRSDAMRSSKSQRSITVDPNDDQTPPGRSD